MRKRRQSLWKRGLAGLMAVTMFASLPGAVPYVVSAAPAEESNLLVHYDMSHREGYLKDVSGNGNDAVLSNISDSDFVKRFDDDVLEFPGKDKAYASLPASIVEGLDYNTGFSVEMTFIPKTAQHQFLWTLGTGNQTDYLFMNPIRPYGKLYVGIKTQQNGEEGRDVEPLLSTKEYSTVTVTSEGRQIKVYLNGKLETEFSHTQDLEHIFEGHTDGVLGYIAKSNWNDPYCDAEVTDFKMYGDTLTADEVQENYEVISGKQKVYKDAESINLPEYTFENLKLPLTAANGSRITWESSDTAVMEPDGTIHPGSKDIIVTLTATFTGENGSSLSRDYSVLVVAAGDMGKLEFLSRQFDLGISYVTEDIVLTKEINGVQIEWTGNDLISEDGKVTRPEKDTQITLQAKFSYGGASKMREFPVTVAGETAGYLASYISLREYDMGTEYGTKLDNYEEKEENFTDNVRTDVMYYALSKDGKTYTALNHDKAVLYPTDPTATIKMGSPSLFRKPDGTYGAIASVDNKSTEILVYDSEDLIFFENQRKVELNQRGILVKNPVVIYNNGTFAYEIYWEGGDGKSYVTETKDFSVFSDPKETTYTKKTVTGTLPEYASVAESSMFELTAEEYERIEKKFGEIHSTAVSGKVKVSDERNEETITWTPASENTIEVAKGSEFTLPEQVQVQYNDGSEKSMNVDWDLAGLDLSKEGTYEIEGKVSRTEYTTPLVMFRADPYIIYNEEDQMYYFTSSYMADDYPEGRGDYNAIMIRRASTINGLTDAEDAMVWWAGRNNDEAPAPYWAPEIHYFGGKWRLIANAGWGAGRQGIFTCENGDMMDPDAWEFTGYIDLTTDDAGNRESRVNSFDTTFFEVDGTCYYVTPRGADWKGALWITTFDPDDPTKLTNDPVIISRGDRAFEYNVLTNQNIQEGSAVLFHEDKIFIAYACATVDQHYATNVIYADVDADLMNPDSWKKYPYPLLSTADLTTTVGDSQYEGIFGPGHNSFTVDENGNPVIIYHARVWGERWVEKDSDLYGLFDPGRHAFVNAVHFGADGFPIFNMTAEQQLSQELETIKLKINVSEEKIPVKLPFEDVDESDWYYDEVVNVFEKGLMTGIREEVFSPNEPLLRAQFAVILYRMEGEPEVSDKNSFADVDDDTWYTDAVAWASDAGIITGYADKKFGPADWITREQMAVILYRYAVMKGYNTDDRANLDNYKDASKVSGFANEAMQWAVGSGIIKGKFDGTVLDPQGDATRAEGAVILSRLLDKYEG